MAKGGAGVSKLVAGHAGALILRAIVSASFLLSATDKSRGPCVIQN
jgi:hypothetical protein